MQEHEKLAYVETRDLEQNPSPILVWDNPKHQGEDFRNALANAGFTLVLHCSPIPLSPQRFK